MSKGILEGTILELSSSKSKIKETTGEAENGGKETNEG